MTRSYKVDAIVLSRRNVGEADKLVTLFTTAFGKKTVVARGIRRIKSRRTSHLEPFSYISAIVYSGKKYDVLGEVDPIDSFPLMRERLERMSIGYIALELVSRLTAENQETDRIFAQLHRFIYTLNSPTTTRRQANEYLATFKQFLLVELGFLSGNQPLSYLALDKTIEDVLESRLKSPALLTNIVMNL